MALFVAGGTKLREGSTLELNMRQLDSIWQEQQVFLPRLTLNTEAPSKATSQMVIKIRNKRRPAVFDADPQAAARAIQASFGVKDMHQNDFVCALLLVMVPMSKAKAAVDNAGIWSGQHAEANPGTVLEACAGSQ